MRASRCCRWFAVVALAAVSLLAVPRASAGALTDLWYAPEEPGWGVNVVHADTRAFVTFFLYGPDRQPTWFTAELVDDGQGVLAGPLYRTRGTPYTQPWSPADHPPPAQVGTATFTLADDGRSATLAYAVDDVAVTRVVQRQSVGDVALVGRYVGGESGTRCRGNAVTTYVDTYLLDVAQPVPGTFVLAFRYFDGGTCTVAGAMEQQGLRYEVRNAQVSCTGERASPPLASNSELRRTTLGIEGFWRGVVSTPDGTCGDAVQFGAVLQP